ncbi:MAG: hypothetical protein ACK4L4_08055 [Gemmobacter sp.]
MFTFNLLATSALGLCLAMSPLMVGAQSAQTGDETDAMFVPLVDACVLALTPETCQQVRAVVTECAGDLDHGRCAVLFEDAEKVFEAPAQLSSAQSILSEAAKAIAAMEFPDVEHSDLGESTRADAERTLLRGDENLMAHSAPPNLGGDAAPSDVKAAPAELPRPVTE